MMHPIFGTSFGRKALFSGMFCSFILFTGFVYTADVPGSEYTPTHELALRGKQLWQKHNCTACHQLYGLGGYLGPDLTNVISAQGKGEMYSRAILKHGTAIMPDFGLQPKEIDELIAFLQHTDQTGQASREYFSADALGQIQVSNPTQP